MKQYTQTQKRIHPILKIKNKDLIRKSEGFFESIFYRILGNMKQGKLRLHFKDDSYKELG
jgi:hypothetical protein